MAAFAGPVVRIRLPPAASQQRTVHSSRCPRAEYPSAREIRKRPWQKARPFPGLRFLPQYPFEHSYELHWVRMKGTEMHHSRLCAVLIDCKTSDLDEAAHFWGKALG